MRNTLMQGVLAAPLLGYGAYKLTKAELTDEPILKVDDEKKQQYLQQRDMDRHGEFKDFGADAFEEVLGKLAGV